MRRQASAVPDLAAKDRDYADLTFCGIHYAQLAVPNIRQLARNDLRFCQRFLIAIEDLPGFIRANVPALLEVNEVAQLRNFRWALLLFATC